MSRYINGDLKKKNLIPFKTLHWRPHDDFHHQQLSFYEMLEGIKSVYCQSLGVVVSFS